MRAGVIAAKIAAHAGDVARGLAGADTRDKKLGIARADLDWKTHIALSLDPKTAQKMHDEACEGLSEKGHDADYCSMCGKQWCSARINKEIRQKLKEEKIANKADS